MGQRTKTAFEEIKRVISRVTILAFSDFYQPSRIHTDSSKFQLGTVIMQNSRPLAFYSRKLNQAQKNYPSGEQELLFIVKALKEFKSIQLGQGIVIHTDHKNLLYEKSYYDRIIRWRVLSEAFGSMYENIRGEYNIVADALSRLNTYSIETVEVEKEQAYVTTEDLDEYELPLSGKVLQKYQQADKKLQKLSRKYTTKYTTNVKEALPSILMYKCKVHVSAKLQSRII